MLLDPNSNWNFDSQNGLTKTKVTLGDFGSYKCVGTFENATVGPKFFHIRVLGKFRQKVFTASRNSSIEKNNSIGIELYRNESFIDPVRGSNVTLVCRAFMFPSPPEWFYYQLDETGREVGELVRITETNPPEGR